MDVSPPSLADHGFRPDIEGVRAIAVVAVLLFHVELGPFDGGFVGVDVFFVLSGFLITSLMLKEIAATGTISLGGFWARRARRLLPASAVVLVGTVVASQVLFDPITRESVLVDGFGACFFVVNLVFGFRGGDYFTLDSSFASPLLHFWSLAVEEQFYVVWPIVLWALAKFGERRWIVYRVTVVGGGLISLALCVWMTPRNPNSQQWAFYLLPTRMWELFAGALVALCGGTIIARTSWLARAIVAWGGVIGIVVVSITYRDGSPPFPGWGAVLPVVCTVAVVGASTSRQQVGPARLLGTAPMLWVGARSYAIYLWHWPVWVFAKHQWGAPATAGKVLIAAIAVGAAAVSFRLIENPIRHHPVLTRSVSRSLKLGGSIIAVAAWTTLVIIAVQPQLSTRTIVASPTLATPTSSAAVSSDSPPSSADGTPSTGDVTTTSAAAPASNDPSVARAPALVALVDANRQTIAAAGDIDDVPGNLRPSLRGAANDKPTLYDNGCIRELGQTSVPVCVFGDADAATHVVLFGDSHAAQWFPAFLQAATNNGWLLEVHAKRGCPTAAITLETYDAEECATWRANVADRLAATSPDLVVMTAYRYKPGAAEQGMNADEVWRRGLDETLTTFRPLTTELLILGDSPTPREDVIQCVATHLSTASACVRPRADAVRTARLQVESDLAVEHDAHFEPTSDWLCSTVECPVIIGDVLVYRDHNHITTTAATLLTPYVEAAVEFALSG